MKILAPVLGSHAKELYKLITNSNVTDTILWDGPKSLKEYESALLEREVSMRNGEIHMFTILEPSTLAPIGSATVRPEEGTTLGDVGLWIGEPFQGKGIGTRVIAELIDYSFQKLQLQKITASVFAGNIGSRRAFEKCGFHLQETLPEASLKRGKKLDDWVFALTREKFLAKSEVSSEALKAALNKLSGSELTRLLIDTFAERVTSVSPAQVLNSWEQDRFVQPSPIPVKDFIQFDLVAFAAAKKFKAVELSPVCPFGTNTSVAPMSQKKVLSTIRSSEVVADSTNVLALMAAVERRKILKANPKDQSLVHLCSSHRLVRVQKFNFPGATGHFKVFAMITAGRDTGHHEFEANSMGEHILTIANLLDGLRSQGSVIGKVKVHLYGLDDILRSRVRDSIQKVVPSITVENVGTRSSNYYPTTSYKIIASNHKDEELEIGDGGITDWTQKLVGNAKERLMITGIGIDRILANFPLAH